MILRSGNFQITGKYYLMQVARPGAAGSFIPLAHVKLLIKSLFQENWYFFYWQLLIILFAVDIAKKIWNYSSLCFEKGKIYFWRGRIRRGRASWRGAVMAFIPDPPVWDPHTKDDIQKIESVQRRAARWVLGDYSPYSCVTDMIGNLDGVPLSSGVLIQDWSSSTRSYMAM